MAGADEFAGDGAGAGAGAGAKAAPDLVPRFLFFLGCWGDVLSGPGSADVDCPRVGRVGKDSAADDVESRLRFLGLGAAVGVEGC